MSKSKKAVEAPVMLMSEFLYESPPILSPDQIRAALSAALPESKLVSADKTIMIAHENHLVEMKDGKKVPPLTVVIQDIELKQERFAPALSQTWDWSEAKSAVERARHQISVMEMMAFMFEPQIRVDLYLNMLALMIQLAPPVAIHCFHAERVLDPRAFLDAFKTNNVMRMSAILNVRLFRVENMSGEKLMDTRGLASLGLPDLQMHFRDLDTEQIAGVLYNTALYIYEKGDCIQDGHTIAGLTPDQRWKCQHEESLGEPKRLVLDIDPGDPFAAGGRNR